MSDQLKSTSLRGDEHHVWKNWFNNTLITFFSFAKAGLDWLFFEIFFLGGSLHLYLWTKNSVDICSMVCSKEISDTVRSTLGKIYCLFEGFEKLYLSFFPSISFARWINKNAWFIHALFISLSCGDCFAFFVFFAI